MFEEHAVKILWLSIILLPLIHILGTKFRKLAKEASFGKVILTLLLLFAGEIVLVDWLAEFVLISHVKMGFDILWWLIPAYLIVLVMEPFILTPIEEQMCLIIPNFTRFFVATLIYALAVLGIIIFVYESSIRGSILLMLFAIAIIFSIQKQWVHLLIEQYRFRLYGSWFKVGEFDEGEFVAINWQVISLRTRDGRIMRIPKNIVLKFAIKKIAYCREFCLNTTIKVDAVHAPKKVKKILLDAVLSANLLSAKQFLFLELEKEPVVVVTNINNGIIEYTVSYYGDDYDNKILLKDAVLTSIWHHLKAAHITQAVESPNVPN